MRYKVKAIYKFNSVIKGFVEADTPRAAILKAETSGMLRGSEDADDWVAVPVPAKINT